MWRRINLPRKERVASLKDAIPFVHGEAFTALHPCLLRPFRTCDQAVAYVAIDGNEMVYTSARTETTAGACTVTSGEIADWLVHSSNPSEFEVLMETTKVNALRYVSHSGRYVAIIIGWSTYKESGVNPFTSLPPVPNLVDTVHIPTHMTADQLLNYWYALPWETI